jgi:hypothetical protein
LDFSSSVELTAVVVTGLASLVLVFFTIQLTTHSKRLLVAMDKLTRATDHLAKLQVLARITLVQTDRSASNRVNVVVINRGFGPAFEPHMFYSLDIAPEVEAVRITTENNIGWEARAAFE